MNVSIEGNSVITESLLREHARRIGMRLARKRDEEIINKLYDIPIYVELLKSKTEKLKEQILK